MKEKRIYIIGGGPAGLAAAIGAHDTLIKNSKQKEYNKNKQKNKTFPQIIILETNEKFGQTVLRTGNGRCNFSNIKIAEKTKAPIYNNQQFFDKANNTLNQNQKNTVYKFFDNLGLACQVKPGGMMFPYTNKATTVLDVLRYAINERNIKVVTNWVPNSNNIKFCRDDKIIVATGGDTKNTKEALTKIFEQLDYSDNIHFWKEEKILGPLSVNNRSIKSLDGTRAHVALSVVERTNIQASYKILFKEEGELLFRKYGVSGIVVFNASRFVNNNKNLKLVIDFFSDISENELTNVLEKRLDTLNKISQNISLKRFMAGLLLPNIVQTVAKTASLQINNVSIHDIEGVSKAFKKFELNEPKIHDPNQCQVSRGGISTAEIDPTTMALKNHPNIFVAGECVDIDGPCGGYNLHWAWTSGLLAGHSAARY